MIVAAHNMTSPRTAGGGYACFWGDFLVISCPSGGVSCIFRDGSTLYGFIFHRPETQLFGYSTDYLMEYLKMKLFYSTGLYALILAAGAAQSQTADLTTNDPTQIAAECGGDAGRGVALFEQNCAQCHDITPSTQSKSGPNLHGVVGRTMGSLPDYPYSAALRAGADAGTLWDQQNLHKYLMDPAGYLAGTTMQFDGFANRHDMFDILTYIRTASLPPTPERGSVTVPAEMAAIVGDVAYGEYLAGECMACHSTEPQDTGLPAIHGWDDTDFMIALLEYKLRARDNAPMQMVAQALNNEEIAALAAYFGALD